MYRPTDLGYILGPSNRIRGNLVNCSELLRYLLHHPAFPTTTTSEGTGRRKKPKEAVLAASEMYGRLFAALRESERLVRSSNTPTLLAQEMSLVGQGE